MFTYEMTEAEYRAHQAEMAEIGAEIEAERVASMEAEAEAMEAAEAAAEAAYELSPNYLLPRAA